MRAIRRIVVHHSAGRTSETPEEIRRFHTAPPPTGRGWSDIGYHWVVYQVPSIGTWTIGQGRPETAAGAHDEGQNADSIGVCVCGDYTHGPLSIGALLTLIELLVDLCTRYKIEAVAVEGHRENEPATTPTACPGFEPFVLRATLAGALALTRPR